MPPKNCLVSMAENRKKPKHRDIVLGQIIHRASTEGDITKIFKLVKVSFFGGRHWTIEFYMKFY